MFRIESRVLDGRQPAVLRFAGLEFGDFFHDILPCAGRAGGVARFPIDARQMQTERGGVFVFVLGRDEPKGFVLVAGLEGFLFAGGGVLVVINILRTKEYAESLYHVIFHFMAMNQPGLISLASSGRVRDE
jgi:hypothetical protein